MIELVKVVPKLLLHSIVYLVIGLPYVIPSSQVTFNTSPIDVGTAQTKALIGRPGTDLGVIAPRELPS